MKGPKTNDRRFPLPHRTGHADFPHPALARVVCSRKCSQCFEAQVLQVSVQADALSSAPTALAAPLQMAPQTVADKMIKVAKGFARVAQFEVVGPTSQMAVQSFNQFGQGCMALLGVDELAQRFSLPRHRFGRWLQVPVSLWSPIAVAVIPKGIAQEVQALTGLAQVQHASLFAVDLQSQPAFQFGLDPAAQLRADMMGQDD